MSKDKKNSEVKGFDIYELRDNILWKNDTPAICPLAPVAVVPKQGGIMGQNMNFEERRIPCNRSCPHSMLFKVLSNNKIIYQTRCVPGWPQHEVVIKNSNPNLKIIKN
jgi:hypothetical protein